MTTRVGIVGPLLGVHPGWVTSQGEVLAEALRRDGDAVHTTSSRIARARRAVDTWRTVASWRDEVDVVVVLAYSGRAFAMTDLATRAAARIGAPIVLWLHGGGLPEFARRHRRWANSVASRARRAVAPSSYLAGGLADLPVSIDVIPNLVDPLPEFVLRERCRPRVLWMRTFHPLYRPELAVDVIDGLRTVMADAHLSMAGQDKGALAAIRAEVEQRGIADRVGFLGFLDADGKAAAFADHDVMLNTPATDNAPVSLVEAAGAGLPIVSTDVGGVRDLFGGNVLLEDDAEGLVTAVRRLVDEPSTARELSQGGRAVAEASTWAHAGPLWRALLDEVAGA